MIISEPQQILFHDKKFFFFKFTFFTLDESGIFVAFNKQLLIMVLIRFILLFFICENINKKQSILIYGLTNNK